MHADIFVEWDREHKGMTPIVPVRVNSMVLTTQNWAGDSSPQEALIQCKCTHKFVIVHISSMKQFICV